MDKSASARGKSNDLFEIGKGNLSAGYGQGGISD
jgi:hypothetical protein